MEKEIKCTQLKCNQRNRKKWINERQEEFRQYLKEMERSENTIDAYLNALKQFYLRFDELSKENMILFKKQQLEDQKPKTAALRCCAMNVYCEFVNKHKFRVKGVTIHNASNVENVITLDEYWYFIDCLKRDGHEKVYWMVRYMASTGCRVSELVQLEKTCLMTGRYSMWSKGKIRKILIPQRLIDESQEYFENTKGKYLFSNRSGDILTKHAVNKFIAFYGERYGIRKEVLHPHSFRHLFAISFLKENNNLALLQDLLGHESIATTTIYLRLSVEEQINELNKTVVW